MSMTWRRGAALVLAGLGVVLGASACAIWFVSSAHGHGLAAPDQRAIVGLSVGCVSCLVAAGVLHSRQPRAAPDEESR